MADENESKDETSSEATKKVTVVIMNISTVHFLCVLWWFANETVLYRNN